MRTYRKGLVSIFRQPNVNETMNNGNENRENIDGTSIIVGRVNTSRLSRRTSRKRSNR